MAIVLRTVSDSKQAQQDLAKLRQSVDNIRGSSERMTSSFANMAKTVLAGGGLYLAVRQYQQLADTVANINSRIRLVTRSQQELNESFAEVVSIAGRTRNNLEGVAKLYSKVARAGEDYGISQRQALKFTEAVSKAITVSGSNAQEAAGALLQFGQALASNRLAGEELRAVMEGAPELARTIAEGLKVGIGDLKKLGEAGSLSFARVFKAIYSQTDEMDRKFGRIQVTYERAFENMRTAVIALYAMITRTIFKSTGSLADLINDVALRLIHFALRFEVVFLKARIAVVFFVLDVIGLFSDLSGTLDKINNKIFSLADRLRRNWKPTTQAFVAEFGAVVAATVSMMERAYTSVFDYLDSNSIGEKLLRGLSGVSDILSTIFQDAVRYVAELWDSFKSIDIRKFFPDLRTITNFVKDWAIEISFWFDWLYDKITYSLGPVGTVLREMFTDIAAFAREVWNKIPKISVADLFPDLKTVVNFVKDWAIQIEIWFEWLYDRVIGHSWIPDLVSGVVTWFRKLLGPALSIVKDFAFQSNSFFSRIALPTGLLLSLIKFRKALLAIALGSTAVIGATVAVKAITKPSDDKGEEKSVGVRGPVVSLLEKIRRLQAEASKSLEKLTKGNTFSLDPTGPLVRTFKQVFGMQDTTPGEIFGEPIDVNAFVGRGPLRKLANRPFGHDVINAIPGNMQVPLIASFSSIIVAALLKAFDPGMARKVIISTFTTAALIFVSQVVHDSRIKEAFYKVAYGFTEKISDGITGIFSGNVLSDPLGLLSIVSKSLLIFAAGRKFIVDTLGAIIKSPTKFASNFEAVFSKRRVDRELATVNRQMVGLTSRLTGAVTTFQGAYQTSIGQLMTALSRTGSVMNRATAEAYVRGGNLQAFPRGAGTEARYAMAMYGAMARAQANLANQGALRAQLQEMRKSLQERSKALGTSIQESRQAVVGGIKNYAAGAGGIVFGVAGYQIGTEIAKGMAGSPEWQKIAVQLASSFIGQGIGAAVGLVMASTFLAALSGLGALFSPVIGLIGSALISPLSIVLAVGAALIAAAMNWDTLKNLWNTHAKPVFDAFVERLEKWVPQLVDAINNAVRGKGKELLSEKVGVGELDVGDVAPGVVTGGVAIAAALAKYRAQLWEMISNVGKLFGMVGTSLLGSLRASVGNMSPGWAATILGAITTFIGGIAAIMGAPIVALGLQAALWAAVLSAVYWAVKTGIEWWRGTKPTQADVPAATSGEFSNYRPSDKEIPPYTRKAYGGIVRGPGTGTSDSIPAMLSDGEFVVNARSTARYRRLLEALNARKMANGGLIGAGTSFVDFLKEFRDIFMPAVRSIKTQDQILLRRADAWPNFISAMSDYQSQIDAFSKEFNVKMDYSDVNSDKAYFAANVALRGERTGSIETPSLRRATSPEQLGRNYITAMHELGHAMDWLSGGSRQFFSESGGGNRGPGRSPFLAAEFAASEFAMKFNRGPEELNKLLAIFLRTYAVSSRDFAEYPDLGKLDQHVLDFLDDATFNNSIDEFRRQFGNNPKKGSYIFKDIANRFQMADESLYSGAVSMFDDFLQNNADKRRMESSLDWWKAFREEKENWWWLKNKSELRYQESLMGYASGGKIKEKYFRNASLLRFYNTYRIELNQLREKLQEQAESLASANDVKLAFFESMRNSPRTDEEIASERKRLGLSEERYSDLQNTYRRVGPHFDPKRRIIAAKSLDAPGTGFYAGLHENYAILMHELGHAYSFGKGRGPGSVFGNMLFGPNPADILKEEYFASRFAMENNISGNDKLPLMLGSALSTYIGGMLADKRYLDPDDKELAELLNFGTSDFGAYDLYKNTRESYGGSDIASALKKLGFAYGGRVLGPGGPRDDLIPALLSNGEFVVNAASARRHGDLLEAINSGRVSRLAGGGSLTLKEQQFGVYGDRNSVPIKVVVVGGYTQRQMFSDAGNKVVPVRIENTNDFLALLKQYIDVMGNTVRNALKPGEGAAAGDLFPKTPQSFSERFGKASGEGAMRIFSTELNKALGDQKFKMDPKDLGKLTAEQTADIVDLLDKYSEIQSRKSQAGPFGKRVLEPLENDVKAALGRLVRGTSLPGALNIKEKPEPEKPVKFGDLADIVNTVFKGLELSVEEFRALPDDVRNTVVKIAGPIFSGLKSVEELPAGTPGSPAALEVERRLRDLRSQIEAQSPVVEDMVRAFRAPFAAVRPLLQRVGVNVGAELYAFATNSEAALLGSLARSADEQLKLIEKPLRELSPDESVAKSIQNAAAAKLVEFGDSINRIVDLLKSRAVSINERLEQALGQAGVNPQRGVIPRLGNEERAQILDLDRQIRENATRLSDPSESVRKQAQDDIDAMNRQIAGVYDRGLLSALKGFDRTQEVLARFGLQLDRDTYNLMPNAVRDWTDKQLQEMIRLHGEISSAGDESARTQAQAQLNGIRQGMNETIQRYAPYTESAASVAAKGFTSNIAHGFGNAISDALKGKRADPDKSVLRNMIDSFLDTITNTIIDTFVSGMVNALFNDGPLGKMLEGLGAGIFGKGNLAGGGSDPTRGTFGGGVFGNVAYFGSKEGSTSGMLVGGQFGGENVPATGMLDGLFMDVEASFSKLPELFEGLWGSLAGAFKDIDFGALGKTISEGFSWITSLFGAATALAEGGRVTGPGTGTSDSIPAMLSAGEFVVNAAAAKSFLPLLETINSGGMPNMRGGRMLRFAGGGLVHPSDAQLPDNTARLARGKGEPTVVNINITGDVSRQTRAEVFSMLPHIAEGVNLHNREKGYRG